MATSRRARGAASSKGKAGKKTSGKSATGKSATGERKARKTVSSKRKTKRSARSRRSAAGAGAAAGLKVRMYRVGFGDFFLVTVPSAAGPRYIVIDCGVFKGTTGKGDIGSIEDAVEDCYELTGGKLALVIMTHRHADHIAGFSRVARWKDFTAEKVWMPHWERGNVASDEAKAAAKAAKKKQPKSLVGLTSELSAEQLQEQISSLAERLATRFAGRTDREATQALDMLGNATGLDFSAAASPSGKKKLSGNAAALDLLKNGLTESPADVHYYGAGDEPDLPPGLEALQAQILGPPPEDDKQFMKLMDLKKGVGQYLDSTALEDGEVCGIVPFDEVWTAATAEDYPQRDARGWSIDYSGIAELVDGVQPDMLVAAAASIDNNLNNQSLVVLFTFGGKNLLFVGDAQAGNWEHWLYNLDAPVKDPTKAGDMTPQGREVLTSLDFYKVGHHGSTNATPIAVVEALREAHPDGGYVSMCSTQTDTYGNPDKGSEVPRIPLMENLEESSALVRSDAIEITLSDDTVIGPVEHSQELPEPRLGTLTKGRLYVEYAF